MKLRISYNAPSQVNWGIAASPVGRVAVGLTKDDEICRLSFLHSAAIADILAEWQNSWPRTKFSTGAKVADFMTKRVLLAGTNFQTSVWRVMTKIPSGKVLDLLQNKF
jgi:O6-methylguanine-DNA--protein-cysteine methyltransferase